MTFRFTKNVFLLTTLCLFLAAAPLPAQQASRLIANAEFETWQNGKPVDWDVEIGATNGANTPKSRIVKGSDGSLQLSGKRSTLAWNFVSQQVDVKPGDTLQLTYTAKATGLRREARQFDNCYVGVFLKNRRGGNVGQFLSTVSADQYSSGSQIFRVGNGVSSAQVAIFLSKSGTLNVKQVSLKKLQPADSFELLVADMDRNYSFFEHKAIDWKELTDGYRQRANAANSADEFREVITEMLAELKDMHVWVIGGGKNRGRRLSKFRSSFDPNYDFRVVDQSLKMKKKIPRFGLVGTTAGGFGYVRVTSLSGLRDQDVKMMLSEIESLFNSPGMIIDLRRNAGGAEPIAAQIASMFADRQVVYAKHKFRSGPNHGDFTQPGVRTIGPRKGEHYTKPVVCLLGPGAVSSAEGFAMMMKAIGHCTSIGKPTRGASGNPQPAQLPNGVDVWYSRWMSLTPAGQPIEDVGVQPDIEVEHVAGSDATFEKAIEVLKAKTK